MDKILCNQASVNMAVQADIWTRDLVWPRARELTQATSAHASMIILQKQQEKKKKHKSPLVVLV